MYCIQYVFGRDLATNWNIDIAHELEDYLEQLEGLSIEMEQSQELGVSNLNFAQAALLIQGTACIYSRKVEYLYALVYQTLEHLAQQHTKTNTEEDVVPNEQNKLPLKMKKNKGENPWKIDLYGKEEPLPYIENQKLQKYCKPFVQNRPRDELDTAKSNMQKVWMNDWIEYYFICRMFWGSKGCKRRLH